MKIVAACASNIGKKRPQNEDNFYFDGKFLPQKNDGTKKTLKLRKNCRRGTLVGVFDGMGGEACGEVASHLAASEAAKFVKSNKADDPVAYFQKLCDIQNRSICRETNVLRSGRMGTTSVCLLFLGDEVYSCNLGDSRSYRVRNGGITQLSVDHTETPVIGSRRKPRITQCLGVFPDEADLHPSIEKGLLESGDGYIMCSDGLTDLVTDDEICRFLSETQSPADCVDGLISLALERGGKDNVTVIVCRVL